MGNMDDVDALEIEQDFAGQEMDWFDLIALEASGDTGFIIGVDIRVPEADEFLEYDVETLDLMYEEDDRFLAFMYGTAYGWSLFEKVDENQELKDWHGVDPNTSTTMLRKLSRKDAYAYERDRSTCHKSRNRASNRRCGNGRGVIHKNHPIFPQELRALERRLYN